MKTSAAHLQIKVALTSVLPVQTPQQTIKRNVMLTDISVYLLIAGHVLSSTHLKFIMLLRRTFHHVSKL